MNDTVSGVFGGVFPNTEAFGSEDPVRPDGTVAGVFGLGVAATATDPDARGRTIAAAPANPMKAFDAKARLSFIYTTAFECVKQMTTCPPDAGCRVEPILGQKLAVS
jgi:hypothetical protein